MTPFSTDRSHKLNSSVEFPAGDPSGFPPVFFNQMKLKALRTLYGDYGHVNPGDVFEVPDWQAKELLLNHSGSVTRVAPPIDRSAYTVVKKMAKPHDNKAITAPENKAVK